MKKVLILCTGNSCRSIMAEALVNNDLVGHWQAFSAGVAPTQLNPRTVQVLAEIGVTSSNLYSKSVEQFLDRDDLDLVITVCDHAKETCPIFPRQVEQVHIDFEDPAPYTKAKDEEALPRFREVRDRIRKELIGYLKKKV